MSTFSSEQRSIMQEKLSQGIKDFAYRYKRYGINYSVTIGYSPENVDFSHVVEHIRNSDRFITLDSNTCAVILDCADDECGIKASNNLLTHFQGEYFSTTLYACLVTASNYSTPALMTHELFYLLAYAIENNMNNILVEHSQVIQK